MTRVSRRAGSKALVCFECVKATRKNPGKTARNVGSFRGRSIARLNRHIQEVHRNPRTIRPAQEEE